VLKDISLQDVHELGRESAIFFYRLVLAYCSFYCLYEYGFFFVQCDGPSMMPTMNEYGDIVLVERITPRLHGMQGGCRGEERILLARQQQKQHPNVEEWHEPFVPVNKMSQEGKWDRLWKNSLGGICRGDIVVAENPAKPGTVCKRVIGLPGDEVIVKQSQYRASHFVGKTQKATAKRRRSLHKVPDGHVWLEGDNSSNSHDSRSYGAIPASMVLGRVILRVWPPGTDPILERAMGPKSTSKLGQPRWASQASAVLPAGYDGPMIVKKQH
jgi:signal peptidase I